MRNSKIIVVIILSFMVLVSCSKSSKITTTQNHIDIATERYGESSFNCNSNGANTLELCVHQTNSGGTTAPSWEYFVFNKETEKIVFENSVNQGKVKWFSNSELVVTKMPGTMAEDQTMDDYAWIIDVNTGRKIKKSEYRGQKDY